MQFERKVIYGVQLQFDTQKNKIILVLYLLSSKNSSIIQWSTRKRVIYGVQLQFDTQKQEHISSLPIQQ